MAATAMRPSLPTLETPQSATFPSEIASPLLPSPCVLRGEEPMKTPLTPPAAYLSFLKKSPALSPPASATLFPRPLMPAEKPALTSTPSTESFTSTKSSTSTLDPLLDSSASEASSATAENPVISFETLPSELPAAKSENDTKKDSASTALVPIKDASRTVIGPIKTHSRRISMPPPSSPFSPNGPHSARSPRRLVIPTGPYSPRVQSPLSAGGLASPYAIISPRDREPTSAAALALASEKVSVKQVVTRTMQLMRPHAQNTPIMEPVPASKKRKIECIDVSEDEKRPNPS